MQRLKKVVMAAALLVAAGAVDASAGTIKLQAVSGGALESFKTPPASGVTHPNDVIPKLWGYLNGNLVLDGASFGDQYLVEFTLVGSESGWTNRLRETGGGTFRDEPGPATPISYVHTATGAANDFLKFQFETIAPPSQAAIQPILVNGVPVGSQIGNGTSNAARTFFVSFCIDTSLAANQQKSLACNVQGNSLTGDAAWLALDDSGAGPNDDHDDWVGYVSATRIPTNRTVPDGGATAGLLGAAMIGLGALRRKFNA